MKKNKGRSLFILVSILPALILYTVFMVIPTLNIFKNSLYRWGGLSNTKTFIGLENFRKLMTDDKFIKAFQNTVFLIVIVTIITMIMAIFFASVFTREDIKGQTFFRIVFYIPNILSIAVISAIFAAVYGQDDGLINGFFSLLKPDIWQNIRFLGDENLVVYSIAFAMVWQAVGYYMVMYMSTMSQIPKHLYEAASIDGARPIKQFFDITLPLSWETVRTTLTFYVISNINISFQIVKVLTNSKPNGASATLLNYMYDQAYTNSVFGYGLAIGVVVFIFSFTLSGIISRVTKREIIQF